MGYFCSLFSGSTGNSYLYKDNGTFLIDCGGSFRKICKALEELESSFSEIEGILITHEHSDHINSLKTFLKKSPVPVYANEKTLEKIKSIFPEIDDTLFRTVEKNKPFYINDIEITPFNTCHDSADSMGYTINNGNKKLGIATDMGKICEDVEKNLLTCHKVLIESNHDVNMLLSNPRYPYPLKRRILSDFGHLSNENCAKFIVKLLETKTDRFILGHLSRENNLPSLALETARETLSQNGATEKDYSLFVADFDKISEKIML